MPRNAKRLNSSVSTLKARVKRAPARAKPTNNGEHPIRTADAKRIARRRAEIAANAAAALTAYYAGELKRGTVEELLADLDR